MSIAQEWHPALLPALTAAVARAKAAFPAATVRIEKGRSLVLQDGVSDLSRMRPGWFTVASQSQAETCYDVVSGGSTVCNCPDYERHGTHDNGYLCKHGFAVLLVRAARREALQPRLRHAYHMASGEEGHCRVLAGGRVAFHPGGRKYSVVCMRDDVCIGPLVNAA